MIPFLVAPNVSALAGCDKGSVKGNGKNQNGDSVNDNIRGDVRNVIKNNDRRGCTYKEFLAYNPKEYDGKGGSYVVELSNPHMRTRTHCSCETMPWSGLAMLYTLIDFMSWLGMVAAMEPTTIQKAMQIAGTLTDEALRNGSIKKKFEKRVYRGEPSKDRNGRDNNKRTRTGNAFATTANPVRREYTGMAPKCTTCNFHHPPEMPCRTYFNCNRPRQFAKDCRVVPRNVNPINVRNLTARACYEFGSTDHVNAACPRLNQAQRPGRNIKTKSWLLIGVRVMGTTITRHVEGHSCWEQRRLARTRTS
ncbi:hypothetical protein Tco_1395621 [Tanacetum coccineum]